MQKRVVSATWYVSSLCSGSGKSLLRRKPTYLPVLFAAVLFTAVLADGQNVSDSTAPQVSNISFSNTSVDTTSGAQSVTMSVDATDDLSGVNYAYVYLETTSTSQPYNYYSSTSCYVYNLQSGSRTSGTFTGTCSFPQYSQSGTWFVYEVVIYDMVGNYRVYYTSDLQSISQTIAVTAPTAPPPPPPPAAGPLPSLVSASLSPSSVDTSNSSQNVTITAHITSSDGTFNFGYICLENPTYQQSACAYFYSSSRTSGDAYDGVYQADASLRRYSYTGNWIWYYALLYNTAFHYSEYYPESGGYFTSLFSYDGTTFSSTNLGTSGPPVSPENLLVTSTATDSTPPTLVDFEINPSSIDVSTSSKTITFTVAAADDLSGFEFGCFGFVSPNGQQFRSGCFYPNVQTVSVYFPQYSQAGNWYLSYMYLYDNDGNSRFLSANDLTNLGFPNSIQVGAGLQVANASGPYGGTVTLSAVLTHAVCDGNSCVDSPSVGETISFAIQGNPVDSAVTDNTGTATLSNVSVAGIAAGTYFNAITASFAGDGTQPATSGTSNLTVTNKLDQTINFAPLPDHLLSDSPITLGATASSGLTVSFAAVGNCTVSGNSVTLTSTGTCKIVASQPGDATYNPAPTVSRSFTIAPATPTVSVNNVPGNAVYGGSFMPTYAYSGDGTTSVTSGTATCTVSNGVVSFVGTGTCTLTAHATAGTNYAAATGTAQSLTIAQATTVTTVTMSPYYVSQQYSDPATFTATITPAAINGFAPAGSVTFYVGAQVMGTATLQTNGSGGLVAILSNVPLLEPTPFSTAPTGQMVPGSHTVTAVFNNINPNFTVVNPTNTLTIAAENARATYTGALFVGTACATCNTATVTLSATIRDITAVAGDPAYDPYAGDIRNAKVTFINRDNNTVIASNLPVGLVGTDTQTGTATYNWSVNLGTQNSQSYTVGIIVTNYYTRNSSADNTVVTVSEPLTTNFITGGGYLVLQSPAGLVGGLIGSNSNFGFNVKYNSGGTNLQGSINAIVRSNTCVQGLNCSNPAPYVYQVKGNSMTSLSVQTNHATFNGKASIRDITNPLSPISIDGNGTLQVVMTDNGEPGTNDTAAITVWNKSGGLWFSSNWNGTTTTQKTLAGGDLVVH
jgi:hypothetical protein